MPKIIGINYANEKYKKAQKLNSWSMLHKGKVDKVIEYSPLDLDEGFREKNSSILEATRGNGYWLWKPYIICKTLEKIEYGDYVFYCDSGAVILHNVRLLINSLRKTKQDIMCFSLELVEKNYSKRDAFILMDCDDKLFFSTFQRLATYIIVKKTDESIKILVLHGFMGNSI